MSVFYVYLSLCLICVYALFVLLVFFFFFKQKTAYEMRISDWSSDVCSSDLVTTTAERLPEAADAERLVERENAGPWRDTLGNLLRQRSAIIEIGRASCRERVCQYV